MKKKTEIILVILLLLLATAWRFIFWHNGIFGSDALYHYSVVEQALKEGKLSNDNLLSVCYEGITTGHPQGYYVVPYFLGKIVGVDNAFIIAPIILGLITLFCAYLLIKSIWNTKVALLTLFFLAISLGHISKSFAFSWRGENIVYPFILLSLFWMLKSFSKKEKSSAILAGIISGLTAWFWNGYPLVMIVFFCALFFYISCQYFKADILRFKEEINLATISVGSQAVVLMSIIYLTEQSGKAVLFGKEYYLWGVLMSILALWVLRISKVKKTKKPFIGVVIIGAGIVFLLWNKIRTIAQGFGSIKPEMPILELQQTLPHQYFFAFYILCVTSILGLYFFCKEFNNKKAIFAGLLMPSLYLIITASRYIYFASIPIITLTAIFLNNKKIIRKKFDIFIVITFALMAIMMIYSLYAVPRYFSESLFIDTQEPYLFIKENSETDACVVEISGRGATIEGLSKRYSYFEPIGFSEERHRKVGSFLLANTSENTLGIDNLYILLNYRDFSKLRGMAKAAEKNNITFFRINEGMNEKVNETKVKEDSNFMKYIYVNEKMFINESGKGCVYVYLSDYFYLSDEICESNMFKMITNQTMKNFKNVYFKDGYAIYKYEVSAS